MKHINLLLTYKKIGLRSLNKCVALQNVSTYQTWKHLRKQCKSNRLKKIVPTWNDEFELPGDSYSVSDIEDCIEYITKNMK